MSKDMGFFVYLGYISGYVREIPGVYARGDSALYLQCLLSPHPQNQTKIAACQSKTLAGGYLSLVVSYRALHHAASGASESYL